ncbi:SPOSA6832_01678, partial [Sporobolomyces salmonicolor]
MASPSASSPSPAPTPLADVRALQSSHNSTPTSSPASTIISLPPLRSPSTSKLPFSPSPSFSANSALAPSGRLSLVDSLDFEGPTRVGSTAPSLSGKDQGDAEEKQVASTMEEDEYPEGGMRAWLAVTGSTLVLMCTFGLSNSYGAFLNYYNSVIHQLAGYPTSDISWIGSAHLCITFGGAFFAGVLFDKGYFQYQLAFGSAFWLIGIFCLSALCMGVRCHSCLPAFYRRTIAHLLPSSMTQIALGSMFSPCLSVLGTYFKRNRALVVGVAASGTAIGAVIFPIMLEHLFPKIGFGNSIRALGYLMLGLLLIANLITRPRHVPSSAALAKRTPLLPLLHKIAREPGAWLVCVGSFGIMVCLFIPLFFIVTYAKEVAHNSLLSEYALAIINGTAFFSRIASGRVADRIGAFNTAIPLGLLIGVMTFAMLGATSTAALAIFLILFGVAQGGFISIVASLFMSLADDVSELGLRGGIGFFFVALASLIGSPAAGALLTSSGGYVAPCAFGGAMAVGGCALLFLGRGVQVKRKGSQWV